MSAYAKNIISKLQDLLEQKKYALESIYKLTIAQQEDIEKNQGENLNSFIDEKQKEIEEIEVLDEAFNKTFQIFKSELKIETLDSIDIRSYPELGAIKKITGEIMDLSRKIMDLEEDNKDKVTNIIDGIKEELKTVRLGQKSLKAYEKTNINTGGVYIDRKK